MFILSQTKNNLSANEYTYPATFLWSDSVKSHNSLISHKIIRKSLSENKSFFMLWTVFNIFFTLKGEELYVESNIIESFTPSKTDNLPACNL